MPFPAPRLRRLALPVALLFVAATGAAAQGAAVTQPACDYQRCAYGIAGALHGLVITKGASEAKVATLGFLFTRDVSVHFDGAARDEARRAVTTRRWAALFTDAGLALLVAGAADAASNDVNDDSARLMIGGAALVGVSVPLQFRADTRLARAIWMHNARFAAGAR